MLDLNLRVMKYSSPNSRLPQRRWRLSENRSLITTPNKAAVKKSSWLERTRREKEMRSSLNKRRVRRRKKNSTRLNIWHVRIEIKKPSNK